VRTVPTSTIRVESRKVTQSFYSTGRKYMQEADIYADENEPQADYFGKVYRVVPPVQRPPCSAYVLVLEYGQCELHDWYWFGKRDPHKPYQLMNPVDKELWDAMQEVWYWLEEWELVERRKIGPEDSEYFATDRLTKEVTK
jgi:hypothetical protein